MEQTGNLPGLAPGRGGRSEAEAAAPSTSSGGGAAAAPQAVAPVASTNLLESLGSDDKDIEGAGKVELNTPAAAPKRKVDTITITVKSIVELLRQDMTEGEDLAKLQEINDIYNGQVLTMKMNGPQFMEKLKSFIGAQKVRRASACTPRAFLCFRVPCSFLFSERWRTPVALHVPSRYTRTGHPYVN